MINWFRTVLLAASLMVASVASAQELKDAFNSIGYGDFSGAKAFNTQVRTGVFLGSGRIRFGAPGTGSFTNLISVTPPSFEVGCNGIDYHLGGFSSVNGEQILKVLEAAVPAAAMYALQMVVGGLCGDCLNGLRNVLDTVNQYTRLLNDSCQLGQQLAQKLGAPDTAQTCSGLLSGEGKSDDQFSARKTLCAGSKKVKESLDSFNQRVNEALSSSSTSAEDKKDKAALLQENAASLMNKTWWKLMVAGFLPFTLKCDTDAAGAPKPCERENQQATGFTRRVLTAELFQSLIGAETPDKAVHYPSLDPRLFSTIILCGLNGMNGGEEGSFDTKAAALTVAEIDKRSKIIAGKVCINLYKANGARTTSSGPGGGQNDGPRVLSCGPILPSDTSATPGYNANEDRYNRCPNVVSIPLKDWWTLNGADQVFGEGLLFYTHQRIFQLIAKMQANDRFSEADIVFMGAMPFPMYKAVNLAVTFPELQIQLLGARVEMIAKILTAEYIRSMIAAASKEALPVKAAPEILNEINTQMREVDKDIDLVIAVADQDLLRTDRLTQSILQIEGAMRKSVLSRGIAGNYDISKRMVDVSKFSP